MRSSLTLLTALAIVCGAHAQVPSYVPANGLVGWWPFSGNANDESGNGNNGTLNGPVLAADRAGISDQAYAFNGVSDYIEILNDPSLDLVNEISISAWINTSDFTKPQYIINKSTNGLSDSWLMDLSANPVNESEIRLIIGGLTPVLPYSDPVVDQNNVWYHVVCTYDLQLVRFYVNGALVSTFPATTNTPTNSNNVRIGAPFQPWGPNPQIFLGLIDDIGMWGRALDPNEVTALFNAQVTPCLSTTPVTFSGLDASYSVNDAGSSLVGSPTGGIFIGDGVTGSSFDPAAAGVGTYGIIYTYVDTAGCVNSYAQCTEVTLNVGVGGSHMSTSGVHVYPNPNQGQFTVELELQGLVSLQVFDAGGRLAHNEVFQASGSKTTRNLDLSGLAKGSYTLQVQNNDGSITQQMVIE